LSLQVASIASGSNGNCYYIGNENEAVLIDAGISCRETEKRMRRLGLTMEKVKAIFISHEHGDHIRGVEGFASKHKLPIYITPATFQYSRLRIADGQALTFKAFEPIRIGGLSIMPFPKQHDAADPHSFVVSGNAVNIGVFTDIGAPCINVITHFKTCHAVFLEANYDERMLENGRYPYHLKKRIRSEHGHLSNDQALQLFIEHRPDYLSYVYLSHLSKDNNDPVVARKTFEPHAGTTKVVIASRYEETALYDITGNGSHVNTRIATRAIQTSLF